jgi:hypothetical protein
MYTLDAWIAAWLVPLAVYVLVSGLDDLFLDAAFVYRWVAFHWFGRPWFPWPTRRKWMRRRAGASPSSCLYGTSMP